jgi:hypothetical protein
LPVFSFVLSFNLLVGLLELVGVIEALKSLIEFIPYLGVIFSAIVGLIPGCAPLVLLLGLFGEGVISSAALLAGLFTSAGTGFIVLYKTNRSCKQNLVITLFIFAVGVVASGLFELTGILEFLSI